MNKTSLMAVPAEPTRILSSRCGRLGIYLFGTPHDFGPQGGLSSTMETIIFYARRNLVTDIFFPSCREFNARIVNKRNFLHKIKLPDITLHKRVFADGVVLNRREAFFVASADCPTIIAIGEKIVIAAHAGRDCLIDREEIHTGKPSRKHRSVVDAIMERLVMAGKNKKTLQVFITCGIKAKNFRHPIVHPQHGEKNQILIKYLIEKYGESCLKGNLEEGMISLDDLIKKQFILHGVPPENLATDDIDTYGDRFLGKLHLWHSCARGRTPEEKKRRNGVLVVRDF